MAASMSLECALSEGGHAMAFGEIHTPGAFELDSIR